MVQHLSDVLAGVPNRILPAFNMNANSFLYTLWNTS